MRISTSREIPPFAPPPHELGGGVSLRTLSEGEAAILGAACASDDPYKTLGLDADSLTEHLVRNQPGLIRYALDHEGRLAGVLAIRWPWLHGAFIDMLSVLTPWRRQGLGSAAIDWVAASARHGGANLWATTSEFNVPARSFWKAHGFVETAELADLAAPGYSEILLRLRLG